MIIKAVVLKFLMCPVPPLMGNFGLSGGGGLLDF